jgi:hypothetical protein
MLKARSRDWPSALVDVLQGPVSFVAASEPGALPARAHFHLISLPKSCSALLTRHFRLKCGADNVTMADHASAGRAGEGE